jgi:hypothetical protein
LRHTHSVVWFFFFLLGPQFLFCKQKKLNGGFLGWALPRRMRKKESLFVSCSVLFSHSSGQSPAKKTTMPRAEEQFHYQMSE